MGWYADIERTILRLLRQIVRETDKIPEIISGQQALQNSVNDLRTDVDEGFGILNDKLDKIIGYLIPPPPVKFIVSITSNQPLTKEQQMAKVRKATVDFQLLDNGTATLTATPVDSVGIPTTLPAGSGAGVWTSSNPGLVVTVNPNDASGLTATVAPAQPPALLTGAVCTISVLLPDGVTTITGNSDPIDIIAGGATGFTVVEQ